MTVTAIREIAKSRVLVSVDETFAFVLYKGELRSYGLKEGQEITEEAYRDITGKVTTEDIEAEQIGNEEEK